MSRERVLALLLVREVFPRIDEDIAWHRGAARAGLALFALASGCGLGAGWAIVRAALGHPPPGPAWVALAAGALALVVATQRAARAARRHHCFDPHAYAAMRLAAFARWVARED